MSFKSKTNKFSAFLQKCDIYGAPVSLTYQNNVTYKSSFGGLLTIASITFVGIYFLLLLVEVLDRSKVIVVNSQDFRNILFDRRIYPLT